MLNILIQVEESIGTAFSDVESFAQNCRFSDCTHTTEPWCAVEQAIASGSLSEARYRNYIKLKKEAEFIEKEIAEARHRRASAI